MKNENNKLAVLEEMDLLKTKISEVTQEMAEIAQQGNALAPTRENLQSIKDKRAEQTKLFNSLEMLRKTLTEKYNKELNNFLDIYKKTVTTPYKKADENLKNTIDKIANEEKDEIREQVKGYFEKRKKSLGIDFINFEDTKINVTLNSTVKKLNEDVDEYFKKLTEELQIIEKMANNDEILIEYIETRSLANAIRIVGDRTQKLEEMKKKAEESNEKEEQAQQIVQEQPKTSPQEHTTQQASKDLEELKTMTFSVKGTIPQLKAIKQFILNTGVEVLNGK